MKHGGFYVISNDVLHCSPPRTIQQTLADGLGKLMAILLMNFPSLKQDITVVARDELNKLRAKRNEGGLHCYMWSTEKKAI